MKCQNKWYFLSHDFVDWEQDGNSSYADYMRRKFEHELNTPWLEVAIGEVLRE